MFEKTGEGPFKMERNEHDFVDVGDLVYAPDEMMNDSRHPTYRVLDIMQRPNGSIDVLLGDQDLSAAEIRQYHDLSAHGDPLPEKFDTVRVMQGHRLRKLLDS